MRRAPPVNINTDRRSVTLQTSHRTHSHCLTELRSLLSPSPPAGGEDQHLRVSEDQRIRGSQQFYCSVPGPGALVFCAVKPDTVIQCDTDTDQLQPAPAPLVTTSQLHIVWDGNKLSNILRKR